MMQIDAGVAWTNIYRLRFRKGIQSNYRYKDDIVFQMEIADEFEAVKDYEILLDGLSVRLLEKTTISSASISSSLFSHTDATVVTLPITLTKQCILNGKAVSCHIKIAWEEITLLPGGQFQIAVSYEDHHDANLCILPIYTEYFELLSESVLSSFEQITKPSRLLCTNYREFGCPSSSLSSESISISIHEDYGATIGSHVYDSSIILSKYLLYHYQAIPFYDNQSFLNASATGSSNSNAHSHSVHRPTSTRNRTIVELGAGCGLTSLIASQLPYASNTKVIATDRKSQFPLLQKNISRNSHLIRNEVEIVGSRLDNSIGIINNNRTNVAVTGVELDWENKQQINSFLHSLFSINNVENVEDRDVGPPTFLFLAADVLYDRDAALSLHSLLCTCYTSFTTAFLHNINGYDDANISCANKSTKHGFETLLVYKNRNALSREEVIDKVDAWCSNNKNTSNGSGLLSSTCQVTMRAELVYEEAKVYIFSLTYWLA